MQLIPALDLLDSGVVRLHKGDFAAVTRYDVDPVAHARSLRGVVSRLHVVDLEGARSGRPTQHHTLAAICAAFGDGVQVGGGVRDVATVDALVSAGVARVVLGTAAVRDPQWVRTIVERHPARVIIAVDARDGLVAIDGWTQASTLTAVEVARRFDGLAIDSLLFTDVSRDGTREGPAIDATRELAVQSGRAVIASGGVGTLEHLRALSARSVVASGGSVLGVVVGRALLDSVFTVAEGIAALGASERG